MISINDHFGPLSHKENMGTYDRILSWMNDQIGDKRNFENLHKMSNFLRLSKSNVGKFYKTMKGEQVPKADVFLEWAERLGIRIQTPDERKVEVSKKVHIVKPRVLSTDELIEGPVDDNYLAVPLAAMPVAAGTGMIPEDKIRSWILV